MYVSDMLMGMSREVFIFVLWDDGEREKRFFDG